MDASNYQFFYQLTTLLQQEGNLISSPVLYNFDPTQVAAAALNALAQPLSDGSASPFSAQNAFSAESLLINTLSHIQDLLGHEINLMPDLALLRILALFGVDLQPATYPVLEMVFYISSSAQLAGNPVTIPMATQINSTVNLGTYVVTLDDLTINPVTGYSGTVNARFSSTGSLPSTYRIGEFSQIPYNLSSIVGSCYDDGNIIQVGQATESATSVVQRARALIQTGGTNRVTTARDYYTVAIDVDGAQQANVLPGIYYMQDAQGNDSYAYGDITTVVVYPTTLIADVDADLSTRIGSGRSYQVIGAIIIPVGGSVTIKVYPSVSIPPATYTYNDPINGSVTVQIAGLPISQLLANAAQVQYSSAIISAIITAIQNSVNPPNGNWGDPQFQYTLQTALLNVNGVESITSFNLIDETTGNPLSQTTAFFWHLYEIQNDIILNFTY